MRPPLLPPDSLPPSPRERVNEDDDGGVPEHGPVELVVGAEGDKAAERDTDRVEHLHQGGEGGEHRDGWNWHNSLQSV